MPTDEIVKLERAALDRWGNGDPGGYLDLYAPEVTYFDPVTERRIDGLEAMREYYRPWTGKIHIHRFEMLHPQVTAAGDMAMLSFNLVNYSLDPGQAETVGSRWNCTEVYRKMGGAWKIIHSHWSFTKPDLRS